MRRHDESPEHARPARAPSLDEAVKQIEKQYGAGAIMRLGREYRYSGPPAISSGSLSLDLATGIGGFPRGRIVELFGPESSGKTTLALHAVANAQRAGGTAAIIDAEHSLDPSYARRLGVDLDGLLVSQPDTGEQGLEICELLVRSNAVDIIVVDSVAALVPRAELDGEMGESHVGLQARLMSQALRKLTGVIRKSCACVLFINQIRMMIGVMYGNPETTPGGRALKFYASLRLDIRRVGAIKEGETVVGSRVRVKIVKNKVAPPFREAEFDIRFDRGIHRAADILDVAAAEGIVAKSGSWFLYGETRLGQGRDKACAFLEDNPDLLAALAAKTREKAAAVSKPEILPQAP